MSKRCIAALLVCAGGVSAQPILFGVGDFDPFNGQSLYRIDATTGAATLVGNTGVREIVGIQWDGSRLLGYTVDSDLLAINPSNANATFLGDAAGITPEGDLAILNGTLHTARPGEIGTLSGAGEFTTLVATGGAFDFSGLAFDGAGTLYGFAQNPLSGDALYLIDAVNGGVSQVGLTGTLGGNVGGLDFDTTGNLYLSDGAALFSVDAGTGAASLIGAHGIDGMSGIAVIPTPGSLALLALGAIVARRRR